MGGRSSRPQSQSRTRTRTPSQGQSATSAAEGTSTSTETSTSTSTSTETTLSQRALSEERLVLEQIEMDRRAAARDPRHPYNFRHLRDQEQEQQQQQQAAIALATATSAIPPITEQYHRDPFYTVKHRVESLSSLISSHHEEWKQLSSSPSPDSSKISQVAKTITEMIRVISSNLSEMEEIIVIVEKNRTRYASIDDNELNERKLFINEIKEQMKKVKEFEDTSTSDYIDINDNDKLFQHICNAQQMNRSFY